MDTGARGRMAVQGWVGASNGDRSGMERVEATVRCNVPPAVPGLRPPDEIGIDVCCVREAAAAQVIGVSSVDA